MSARARRGQVMPPGAASPRPPAWSNTPGRGASGPARSKRPDEPVWSLLWLDPSQNGVGVTFIFDPRASGWPGLLLVAAVSCATRELPSSWPDASAASPSSPAAPLAPVTRSLDGPPPLPGDATPGWSGLAPSTEVVPPTAPASHAGHQSRGQGAAESDSTAAGKSEGSKGSDVAADATYTCPMHPDVVSREPGKCPRCGMTLVKRDASN
jgi:hypothetical protein